MSGDDQPRNGPRTLVIVEGLPWTVQPEEKGRTDTRPVKRLTVTAEGCDFLHSFDYFFPLIDRIASSTQLRVTFLPPRMKTQKSKGTTHQPEGGRAQTEEEQ